MKGQSYHRRKIRIQETPEMDFAQLKARTINALDKLGGQRFSAEPGGYALENWARGVNVLLDEFEDKAGGERLSPEYHARRRELDDLLSNPHPVASIDKEMSELAASISSSEGRVETERSLIVSKISDLKSEQTRLSAELKLEQGRALEAGPAENTNSFFRRLLGGKKAPARANEEKVRELESKLDALPDKVRDQQKQLKLIDLRSIDSRLAEEWSQLDAMQSRLKELEKERLEKTQLVKERSELMGSMAEAISKLD